MMTPTARIDFTYEIQYANGDKDFKQYRTIYGGWDAAAELLAHGITLSVATILKAVQCHTYALRKLPYDRADTNEGVIEYFNKRYGLEPNPVVNVHLTFQRIPKR